jgi:hypothetical protein
LMSRRMLCMGMPMVKMNWARNREDWIMMELSIEVVNHFWNWFYIALLWCIDYYLYFSSLLWELDFLFSQSSPFSTLSILPILPWTVIPYGSSLAS